MKEILLELLTELRKPINREEYMKKCIQDRLDASLRVYTKEIENTLSTLDKADKGISILRNL